MKEKSNNIKDKLVNPFKRFTNYLKNLSKKTKIILGVIVLIIIAILVYLIFINKDKKDITVVDNIPKVMYKEKELDGFKFSDIDFDFKNNVFEYKVKVTNTTKEAKDFYGVAIALMKGKNEAGRVELYNKATLQPGESMIIRSFSTKNYTEADKLEYILLKEIK